MKQTVLADEQFDELPEKGYLKEIIWENDASSISELNWDIHVKKRGRTTGVSYGIIAGVQGIMKSSQGGPRRESWALPEALSTSLYEFSNKGDSGTLVWTDKGVAVGMIIASWTTAFEDSPVKAVILQNGYWDTKNIPFFRNGSLISQDCYHLWLIALSVWWRALRWYLIM